ncbi:hypothetical protein M8J77_023417 [Diaphorina citri]|nr:hypothetical protein M8J77_023417 [Diaphorina citri]
MRLRLEFRAIIVHLVMEEASKQNRHIIWLLPLVSLVGCKLLVTYLCTGPELEVVKFQQDPKFGSYGLIDYLVLSLEWNSLKNLKMIDNNAPDVE